MQQGFGIILLAEEVMRERRMTAARYAAEHRLGRDLADGERANRRAGVGRLVAAHGWSVRVPLTRLRVSVDSDGR